MFTVFIKSAVKYDILYIIIMDKEPVQESQEMFKHLESVHPHITLRREHFRHTPKDTRDRIAKYVVHLMAESADFLFKERYGHRAIVLETIAAVPGLIGGFFQHLKSLRFIRDDHHWIKTLLDEAENERMHLLIYSEIAKPTRFERFMIVIIQLIFSLVYSLVYLISPRTAHRVVGYFEEEAINSYEHYLQLVHDGKHENISATALAKKYWNLKEDARLTDVIEATIIDEMAHRDVNHAFSQDVYGTRMWS
jgi:ubiquinol oxidase